MSEKLSPEAKALKKRNKRVEKRFTKAAGRAVLGQRPDSKRPFTDSHAKKFLPDAIHVDIAAVVTRRYPLQEDTSSKDRKWAMPILDGLFMGALVGEEMAFRFGRKKKRHETLKRHIGSLANSAINSPYELEDVLLRGKDDPQVAAALALMPPKIKNAYTVENGNEMQKKQEELYLAGLGWTAQLTLGHLISDAVHAAQPRLSRRHERAMEQEWSNILADPTWRDIPEPPSDVSS